MSAFQSLQRILPLNETAASSNDQQESLPPNNLIKSLNDNTNIQSLEHLRIIAEQQQQHNENDPTTTSVDKLIEFTSKFEIYQQHIQQFTTKLKPVGIILQEFNQELGLLSSSLVSLQQQSIKLSKDSKLQAAVTEKLNPVILDLMIPPELVKSIVSGDIDSQFIDNLKLISEKKQLIENIKTKNIDIDLSELYGDSIALTQLETGVHLLECKAVERIRDFIIQKIRQLRSTNSKASSSQLIQQKLLEVKDIFQFLVVQHKELADQLRLAYIYTMTWYYKSKFAKYLYALEKLHLRPVDSSIVLGGTNDEKSSYMFGSSWKGWISTSSSLQQSSSIPIPSTGSNTTATTASTLTINEYLLSFEKRLEILSPKTRTCAIPSQIAETSPFTYWVEFVYNQFSMAVIDNMVVEYLFMVEFFYQGNEKFDPIEIKSEDESSGVSKKGEWGEVMFKDVFEMGREFLTWLVCGDINASMLSGSTRAQPTMFGTCDAFGILLIIRLIQNTQNKLHNEFHIPILDDYLNSLLLILWPQFTKVIDINCDSMKRAILRFNKSSGLAPISVTQQFAQFLSSLLRLTTPDKDYHGEPLYTSVVRLRNDFENCLTKCSTHAMKILNQMILLKNKFNILIY
ncbi:VPS52 [[Candida] subhashii]|uniref:VPS52 n=1 Tax=[Candida] subhashii TaxID=561895 RepID=A0A8J5QKK9_9ASCO|nr:VPS52 [[Candida] subhashii]KAG7663853.1 VPS52 [[Candida] subhashii]